MNNIFPLHILPKPIPLDVSWMLLPLVEKSHIFFRQIKKIRTNVFIFKPIVEAIYLLKLYSALAVFRSAFDTIAEAGLSPNVNTGFYIYVRFMMNFHFSPEITLIMLVLFFEAQRIIMGILYRSNHLFFNRPSRHFVSDLSISSRALFSAFNSLIDNRPLT